MEIRVSNPSFVATNLIDDLESVLWIERYNSVGEFEIKTTYREELLSIFQEDYYLNIAESGETMIVESSFIESNPDTGPKLTIKGRSATSILDRRIVLRKLVIDSGWQSGIHTILDQNMISSIYPSRNITNFIYETATDPYITGLTLKAQFYSENILDLITSLCQEANVGFFIFTYNNYFILRFYVGKDRSYAQTTNPFVVFSPEFDNLIKSNYYRSKATKKDYALITGATPPDAPGYPIRGQAWAPDVQTGLQRREMHVDATSLSLYPEGSSTRMTDDVYIAQLAQLGMEELARNSEYTLFDGQVDLSQTYKYKVDFFLGDIIQMEDAYGHTARSQITEMTFFENPSGSGVYPTLKTV
jgi:hypothetical protein